MGGRQVVEPRWVSLSLTLTAALVQSQASDRLLTPFRHQLCLASRDNFISACPSCCIMGSFQHNGWGSALGALLGCLQRSPPGDAMKQNRKAVFSHGFVLRYSHARYYYSRLLPSQQPRHLFRCTLVVAQSLTSVPYALGGGSSPSASNASPSQHAPLHCWSASFHMQASERLNKIVLVPLLYLQSST